MSERHRDVLAAIGVVAVVITSVRAVHWLITKPNSFSEIARSSVGATLAAARSVPAVAAAIDAALDASLNSLRDEIAPILPDALHAIPALGRGAANVASALRTTVSHDATRSGLSSGTAFGGIYHVLPLLTESSSSIAPASMDSGSSRIETVTDSATAQHAMHSEVSCAFLDTNLLYPGMFKTARRMEAEAVEMAVALLRDGADGVGGGVAAIDACGLLTSGGTESVLLAIKAHRDAALNALGFKEDTKNQGIPPIIAAARAGHVLKIIAGISVHPAFDKAASLFGLQLIKLPLDKKTLQVSPIVIANALDSSTILIVASAPGFAHGVIDDIAGICHVAETFHLSSAWGKQGIPVHVDNCLGGIHLSFAANSPRFDFRTSNAVSSISMDLHKYGGTPKGSSVIAFRSRLRRRYAYSATTNFPGGLYTTPTLAGSRGGVNAALAWSTLVSTGVNGFTRSAQSVTAAHKKIILGISEIPGLVILGEPHACVVAFTTTSQSAFSIYSVAARMAATCAHWKVALLQSPPGAHVVVTERFSQPWEGEGGEEKKPVHDDATVVTTTWTVCDQWLSDLRVCTLAATHTPHDPLYIGKGDAGIYGAAGALPAGEISEILKRYCDVLTVVQ
jgi:sphinganine-1-phosphate aldolase